MLVNSARSCRDTLSYPREEIKIYVKREGRPNERKQPHQQVSDAHDYQQQEKTGFLLLTASNLSTITLRSCPSISSAAAYPRSPSRSSPPNMKALPPRRWEKEWCFFWLARFRESICNWTLD